MFWILDKLSRAAQPLKAKRERVVDTRRASGSIRHDGCNPNCGVARKRASAKFSTGGGYFSYPSAGAVGCTKALKFGHSPAYACLRPGSGDFGQRSGQRNADQRGQCFHPDFPHDSGAMIVHGALAHVQVRRNVLALLALRERGLKFRADVQSGKPARTEGRPGHSSPRLLPAAGAARGFHFDPSDIDGKKLI